MQQAYRGLEREAAQLFFQVFHHLFRRGGGGWGVSARARKGLAGGISLGDGEAVPTGESSGCGLPASNYGCWDTECAAWRHAIQDPRREKLAYSGGYPDVSLRKCHASKILQKGFLWAQPAAESSPVDVGREGIYIRLSCQVGIQPGARLPFISRY